MKERSRPSLSALTRVFMETVSATFGGGNIVTAALQRKMIDKGWLTEEEFALCYALGRVTPGTNLFAFTTATGWLLRGPLGAASGLIAASAPSCLLVWLATIFFERISSILWVQLALDGAIAAAVGATLASFWQLAGKHLMGQSWLRSWVIVLAAIALPLAGWLSPIMTLALAAVVGWWWQETPAS